MKLPTVVCHHTPDLSAVGQLRKHRPPGCHLHARTTYTAHAMSTMADIEMTPGSEAVSKVSIDQRQRSSPRCSTGNLIDSLTSRRKYVLRQRAHQYIHTTSLSFRVCARQKCPLKFPTSILRLACRGNRNLPVD